MFDAPAVINGEEIVEQFTLESYIGEKAVMFFFYPKDFTFVCPTEILAFQEKLADMGVAETDIQSIEVTTTRNASAGAGSHVRGYQAWARLASCDGYVVVSVSNMCTYRDAHTTGNCRMSDMPTY